VNILKLIYGKHLKNQQDIMDAFSNYFLSIIDKISKNNADDKINYENLSTFYYYHLELFQPNYICN
jgi:hypothetical protein